MNILTQLVEHYADKNINTKVLDRLQDKIKTHENDIANAQETNRVLRIGIVGQIKRGKSSFLNTLLFNGEDILPKAATPMTAALTKISYCETPQAKIEFYTLKEWETVEKQAKDYDLAMERYNEELVKFQQQLAEPRVRGQRQPTITRPIEPECGDEVKASLELYNMAKKHQLDMKSLLGTMQTVSGKSSHKELIKDLEDYVGASGKYTPIVKSTELLLDIDALKNVEIIDTPGMNDPIISRGRRTQEYLGQCDVVFLLSYCGQFLDAHDMGLLAQNIPNKGIDNIVLVGSLFDSVLADEYHKYSDIRSALIDLTSKLNQQAKMNVENVTRQEQEKGSGQSDLMATLQKSLPPVFISSRCADLARKNESDYSAEEKHTFNQLNKMFKGFTFDAKSLEAVANFKKIHTKLEEVKNNKTTILKERLAAVQRATEIEVQQILDAIKDDVAYKLKALQEGDIVEKEQKQQALIKRIESGTVKVHGVFEQYNIQAEKALRLLVTEIKQEASMAKRVESHSGSRQEAYTSYETVPKKFWGFTYGQKTVETTNYRTVNYTYANVHEALSKLEDFVFSVEAHLQKTLAQAIQVQQFKNDIKKAVYDLFDFGDLDFDPDSVLIPLNNALERLSIPHVNLSLEQHLATINEQFTSAQVEGDKIGQLRNEQARVVGLVLDDIYAEIEANIQNIDQKMNHESQRFIPELTKDLQDSIEQLKHDLMNKDQAVKEYQSILEQVAMDKAELGI